ncbi:MAG: sel1 repeat family protein [Myxococcales bacterium]|nr:sel1 repeat family protein [Myxococcales bacterium]
MKLFRIVVCCSLSWGCTAGSEDPEGTEPANDVERFTQGCDEGAASDCANLAALYEEGDGVEADVAMAAQLYGKACEGGDGGGCTKLGSMTSAGEGVDRDSSAAVEFFRKGCEAGSVDGCARAADMVLNGIGVDADAPAAVVLMEQACKADHVASCDDLSSMFKLGARVPRDLSKSRTFAQRACDLGRPKACARLAELLILNGDQRRARDVLDRLLGTGSAKDVGMAEVHGLRLAAGESIKAVAPDLVASYATLSEGDGSKWSWEHLKAHLQESRKGRKVLPIIEILERPRDKGSIDKLKTAMGLDG